MADEVGARMERIPAGAYAKMPIFCRFNWVDSVWGEVLQWHHCGKVVHHRQAAVCACV